MLRAPPVMLRVPLCHAARSRSIQHTHKGKAIHEKHIDSGHKVLENVWGYGHRWRCCQTYGIAVMQTQYNKIRALSQLSMHPQ